jgi:segregation and condensation protein B
MNGEPSKEHKEPQELSIKFLIESLLFVADEPVSVDRLASILDINPDHVEKAISELSDEYAGRGLRLQHKRQRVQMVTAPEAADWIRRFLGLDLTGKLSAAALETLAIVAYRQPVTRGDVEAVRGVNSDSVLRTLVHRGLIEEQGRLEQAGRPIIYGTTFEFLQEFGLTSLDQLPPLRATDSGE